MKITLCESVEAPRDAVFDVFSDIRQVASRISGIEKVEIIGDIDRGLGVQWRETRVMFGKEATEEMKITKFDAPEQYVVEAESHGTRYTSHFRFESAGENRTKVTWEFEGRPVTLGAKLLSPLAFLFQGSVKKMMSGDVLDLKRFVESQSRD